MPSLHFQRPSLHELRSAAPRLLQIALIVALAVQALRLLWIALAPFEAPAAAIDATAPAATATPPALASYGDVFHPRSSGGTDTTGYALLGVRIAGGGGSAILGRDGRQVAYAVGDEVAAGVVLASVAADHVLLRAGDRDHRIPLDRAAPSTLPRPRALPVGAPPARATADASAAVDPGELLADTGLRPRREDGRITGYTVVPRGNEALLQRAGLAAGDVLLAVNGRPIDPEELDDLKRDLHGTATLTVRRGGQTRTLTLQATP